VNEPRVPITGLAAGERALDADAAHYVTRVLRLAEGQRFVVFDPEARLEATATLRSSQKKSAIVHIETVVAASVLPQREVSLIQCVGKGAKLDAVVRDASELSATALYPAVSERSVAERSSSAAHARLCRIAVEAARQSRRGDVLRVEPTSELSVLLPSFTGRRVMLHPGAAPLRDALRALAPREPVTIAIGPEGGFSEQELTMAGNVGFVAASLGPVVLRTETAAAAVLGALLVMQ
jgi:16S rRNA (uracil1498-N3)-methyltransferase